MYFLSGHGAVSEEETRLDVLRFENGVLVEDGFGSCPCGHHFQHMLYSDAHVTDDRLAAKDVASDGDAIEQLGLSCHVLLHRSCFSGFVGAVG